MKAQDIMTAPVITVTPQTAVRDAAHLMVERGISGLPVVDESGRLVGILSEADLLLKEADPRPSPPFVEWFGHSLWLERRVSGYRKAEGRTVGEVMTHNVLTAEEETPVREIASRMVRHGVNRLPIVRGGQVVGIVTRADILKVFLRQDAALAAEAQRIVDEFVLDEEEVRVSVDRGTVVLGGRVLMPLRRDLLLDRLRTIDGVIAVDGKELRHLYRDRPGV
jgi:CBS domain-containing protein